MPTTEHVRVRIEAGTAEMQNFANWFQYHRSRINATKAIIGTTINNSEGARMGMRLFNNGILGDTAGSIIHVASMSDPDQKRRLLDAFYRLNIQRNGTPMRRSLRDVGEYFRTTGSNAPIVSQENGGECQQNFNIVMGDGYWNGNSPDIGNADGDNDSGFDGSPYADGYSDTLADVAMHYYETDLQTGLANRVPIQEGIDEADHQHLVTYSIAFGITGSLDPNADPAGSPEFAWTDPWAAEQNKVDDMWHAAYNGRGKFFNAQQPEELQYALQDALDDISERTATLSAVSINSAKLTNEAVVYIANFDPNGWKGDLIAKKIADLDTGELEPGQRWSADDELEDLVRPPNTNGFKKREILTHDGTEGVKFRWGTLTGTQRRDLRTNPSGGRDVGTIGRTRLDYIRGDYSNEGEEVGQYRKRYSALGDIINSGPVYVGAPALSWPDTAPFPTGENAYSVYKNDPVHTERPGMIYVGANDGMLHGFAEVDGKEEIAYVSLSLYSEGSHEGLHYLTQQDYTHRFYNDLTPTVSDIYADVGSGRGTEWHTVLISGQRNGGRGIFALDVSDPTRFDEDNAAELVIWEFGQEDDADLGYTYSRPQIGMTNDGEWVAIFGNGYRQPWTPESATATAGQAALFILKIRRGVDGEWTLGEDYVKIATGTGSTEIPNGLGTPALADLDGNGTIDRVYAGDLQGRLWAFDLSGDQSSDWNIPDGEPLFTTDGGRPITAQPTLARHPTQSDTEENLPNVMVYVGSGQYLTSPDKTDASTNYFYGIWDRGQSNLDGDDLVDQAFIPGYTDNNGNPVRVLSKNPINYWAGDAGWRILLEDTGERSITKAVVRGNAVFFNTFTPDPTPCNSGGYGYRMVADLATGGSPSENTFDVDGDGVIGVLDSAVKYGQVGVVIGLKKDGFLPEPVFIEDISYTADEPTKVIELQDIPKGRFSWQELIK